MDALVQEARELGRTFRIVGVMPGVILSGWAFMVIAARSEQGTFSFSHLASVVQHIDFASLSLGFAASLAIAFLLQPLQFSMVQLLEGYWGHGTVGHALRVMKVSQNLSRWARLYDSWDPYGPSENDGAADEVPTLVRWPDEADSGPPEVNRTALSRLLHANEIRRELSRLPQPHRMMPTRLGNILKKHEDTAGRQWGLEAVSVLPYVGLSAADKDVAYLNDRRNEMDTAVRFIVIWALAALLSVAIYWSSGWSVLIAAVPWTLSVLSYRGAVGAADHYGEALSVVIALNRGSLYQRLGFSVPEGLEQELEQNRRVMALLSPQS